MTLMMKTLMLTAEIAVIGMMSADGLSHLVRRAEAQLLPVLEEKAADYKPEKGKGEYCPQIPVPLAMPPPRP